MVYTYKQSKNLNQYILMDNITKLIESPLLKVKYEKEYEEDGSYIRMLHVTDKRYKKYLFLFCNLYEDLPETICPFNDENSTFILDGLEIPFDFRTKVKEEGIHEFIIKIKSYENLQDLTDCFKWCETLLCLDLRHFDASSVERLNGFCCDSNGLISVLSNKLNTVNLIGLFTAFSWCTSLMSIDLSGWNISKLKVADNLFFNCQALEEVDLSTWNLTKDRKEVEKYFAPYYKYEITTGYFKSGPCLKGLLSYCRNLKSVKGLENFDLKELLALDPLVIDKGIKIASL